MPPQFIVNLDDIDLGRVETDREGIRAVLPQRFEFEQLHGIVRFDRAGQFAVAYRDIGAEEWWVRGHVPGRPLFPGVLMVEAAAQLCSFYYQKAMEGMESRFIGFGGIDAVKFRGTVVPGDRLILLAREIEMKSRRATFQTQGVVKDRLVYEGIIIGMPV